MINRIESIEAWITSLENDVQTIQTLIVALESNVAVSSVNETDDGYEIVFSNGQTITISDGISTEIAVIEVDGTFYWTLNGEPILDGNGNMIQASADTPYIKDGNWWIGSTDTGVQAQGNDGADGKDGQDGADGLNGQDGADGQDGQDGADGQDGQDGADGATPITVTVNDDGTVTITIVSTGAQITLLMDNGFTVISGLTTSTNGTYIVPRSVSEVPVVMSLPVSANQVSAIQATITGSDINETETMTRADFTWGVDEPTMDSKNNQFLVNLTKGFEEDSAIILKVIVINTSGNEFTKLLVIKIADIVADITVTDTAAGSLTNSVVEALSIEDVDNLTDDEIAALSAITSLNFDAGDSEGDAIFYLSESDLKLIGLMGIADLDLSMTDFATLPKNTFNGNTALESIILPASTTAIEAYAFANTPSFTYFKLPSTILYVGEGAFGEDTVLEISDFAYSKVEFADGAAANLLVDGLNGDLLTACQSSLVKIAFTDDANFTSLGDIEGLKEAIASINKILASSSRNDLISLFTLIKKMELSNSGASRIAASRDFSTIDDKTITAITSAIADIDNSSDSIMARAAGSTQYGYTVTNAVNSVAASILDGTLPNYGDSDIETALEACSLLYYYTEGSFPSKEYKNETITFSAAVSALGTSVSTYIAEVKTIVEEEFNDFISDAVTTVAKSVLSETTGVSDSDIKAAIETAVANESNYFYTYKSYSYSSITYALSVVTTATTTSKGQYAIDYLTATGVSDIDDHLQSVKDSIGSIYEAAASNAVSTVVESIVYGAAYDDASIETALRACTYSYSSSWYTSNISIDVDTALDYLEENNINVSTYVANVHTSVKAAFEAAVSDANDKVYGYIISSIISTPAYSDLSAIADAITSCSVYYNYNYLKTVSLSSAIAYLGTTAADQAAIVQAAAKVAFTNAYNAAISDIGSSIADGAISYYNSDEVILLAYKAYSYTNLSDAELINGYYAYTSLGVSDADAITAARDYSETEYGYVGTITLALYDAALSAAVTSVTTSVWLGTTSNSYDAITTALLDYTLIYNVSDILEYHAKEGDSTITIESLYNKVIANIDANNSTVSSLTSYILANVSGTSQEEIESAIKALDTTGLLSDATITLLAQQIIAAQDSNLEAYYDTSDELTAIVMYIYNSYVGSDVDKVSAFTSLTYSELVALVDAYRASQAGLSTAYSFASDSAKSAFTSAVVAGLQAYQQNALEDYVEDYFDSIGMGEIDSIDDISSLITNLVNLANGDIDEIDDIMNLVSTALAYADQIELMLNFALDFNIIDQDTYDTVMGVIEVVQTINGYYLQAQEVIEAIEDALGVDLSNLEAAFLSTTTTVVNELFATVFSAVMEVGLSGEVTDYLEAIIPALIEVGISDAITDELLNLLEVLFDTSLDVADAAINYVAAYLESELTELFNELMSGDLSLFEDGISAMEALIEDAISLVDSFSIDDLTEISDVLESLVSTMTKSNSHNGAVASTFAGFKDFTKLAVVDSLPSTLIIIGNSAFENTAIAEIELPASVKAIGSRSFADCSNLKSVTSHAKAAPLLVPAIEVKEVEIPFFAQSTKLVIPTKIEVDTFEGVSKSDSKLYVPSGSKNYEAIEIIPSISSLFTTCGEYTTSGFIEYSLGKLQSSYVIDTQWSKVFGSVNTIE